MILVKIISKSLSRLRSLISLAEFQVEALLLPVLKVFVFLKNRTLLFLYYNMQTLHRSFARLGAGGTLTAVTPPRPGRASVRMNQFLSGIHGTFPSSRFQLI